jgi:hypothetical protein
MTPDELGALLRQPESETLEFKVGLPSADEVNRLIAAFANGDGGTLVIGFDEAARQAVGLAHPGVALGHVQEWITEVSPPPDVEGGVVEIEPARHLVVVRVAPGREMPYLAGGQAVERRGNRIVPISPSRIVARIAPAAGGASEIRRLADAVGEQSSAIANMSDTVAELSRRMHWKRQLPIRVAAALGGVVGGYLLGSLGPL